MAGLGNAVDAQVTGFQSLNAATGVWNGRSLTPGSGISISNGDGTGGNPVITNTAGSGITTINGDSGSITGATVTIFANHAANTCGSSVLFTNAGATSTLTISDASTNQLMGNLAGNATLSGSGNSGFGKNVLHGLTTGLNNACFGALSGASVTSGGENSAIGQDSLSTCTTGSTNCAFGNSTLFGLTTGSSNTACGALALGSVVTGSTNIAVGYQAGLSYTGAESNNILVGHNGVLGESGVIRIGDVTQTTCFVQGIAGVTVANTAAVLINTVTGQLGTVVSSRRYKENIQDMNDASSSILKLQPVTFNLKADRTKAKQYGLIAEDVQKVFPDLVVLNANGEPETVKYHDLPVLLLNEVKRLSKELESLKAKMK